MDQVVADPPLAEIIEDHRRAARMRKVRPVAFAPAGRETDAARRTVTANISRGGMLLVSRKDRFPPAGSALTIMPYDPETRTDSSAAISIPGRIVYTRFSPRTELRFAGLKFESDLSDSDARSIGLDGAPDAVARTLQALEKVEALADASELTVMGPASAPTAQSIERELRALRERMDAACAEFFLATERYLAAWGEKRLRDTISERHALARAKGVAGLRGLKEEWRSLKEGLPALIDAQLNRDSIWPHRALVTARSAVEANDVWFYNTERDQPPQRIIDELRKLAGFIGRMVVRHGFEDIGTGGDWTPVAHERGLVLYRGPLVISDPMRDALCNGARLQQDAAAVLGRAGEVEEAEARAEAIRLWESA